MCNSARPVARCCSISSIDSRGSRRDRDLRSVIIAVINHSVKLHRELAWWENYSPTYKGIFASEAYGIRFLAELQPGLYKAPKDYLIKTLYRFDPSVNTYVRFGEPYRIDSARNRPRWIWTRDAHSCNEENQGKKPRSDFWVLNADRWFLRYK